MARRPFAARAAAVVAVGLGALACASAHAASFDCAKAATRVEKAICADPKLGKLDEDVAAAYKALADGLDEPMRQRLLRSQREWLKARTPKPLAADLGARLALLRGARVAQGGVPLLRLAGDDSRPMYVLAAVPGAAAYNQWVDTVWAAAAGQTAELPEGNDKCPSGDPRDCQSDSIARTYKTVVPSPAIVSVEETVVDYEQGAAHPEVAITHYNWWLSRSGRITAADMFSGAGWKGVVAKAARAFSKSQNDLVEVEQASIDSVSIPDAWALTPGALVLSADGYAFNLGRGGFEIEVPWRDFGAVLRPEFAAALKPH